MAKKFTFDDAITTDIKGAASNSYWIEDKNNKQRQPLKKRKSLLSFLRSFL